MQDSDWLPKAPDALTINFIDYSNSIDDIDDELWIYLCNLIPDGLPYEENEQKMLSNINPSLRTYYLTRGFDWNRGSDGLEGCLMKEPEELSLWMIPFKPMKSSAHTSMRILYELSSRLLLSA